MQFKARQNRFSYVKDVKMRLQIGDFANEIELALPRSPLKCSSVGYKASANLRQNDGSKFRHANGTVGYVFTARAELHSAHPGLTRLGYRSSILS